MTAVRAAGLATAVASCLLSAGCQVGSIHALDGEWPIPPGPRVTPAPWAQRGNGQGGALVRTGPNEYRLVTPDGERRLRCGGDLASARVVGKVVYRLHGAAVRRQRLSDLDEPDEAETLALVEGARDLDAAPGRDPGDPSDDVIVVSGEGAVYVVSAQGARALWEGDALAVAVDPRRDAVWIAARAPLPVIELVDLERLDVRLRVPLPVEVESASLDLVVGPRGVVAHAHDRPIASALFIAPELGLALPLRARERPAGASPSSVTRAGFEPEASPPLITPPGVVADIDGRGARLWLDGDPGATFGRIAPLPDGRFLVVEAGRSGVQLGALRAPGPDTRALTIDTWELPEGWSGRVEALGWTDDGAVVVSSQDRLHITAAGVEHERHGSALRDGFRRATNVVLASSIAVLETASALTINTALSLPLVPLSPIPLVFGAPGVAGAMLTAPIWAPSYVAFGIWR